MGVWDRLVDRWRLPGLLRVARQLHHPHRRSALEALGRIGGAEADAVILAALEGSDRDVWIVAAQAAARRRLVAARPALERLSDYFPPAANPDYVPESWAQERVEREMARDEAEEIRAAATAALADLAAATGRP